MDGGGFQPDVLAEPYSGMGGGGEADNPQPGRVDGNLKTVLMTFKHTNSVRKHELSKAPADIGARASAEDKRQSDRLGSVRQFAPRAGINGALPAGTPAAAAGLPTELVQVCMPVLSETDPTTQETAQLGYNDASTARARCNAMLMTFLWYIQTDWTKLPETAASITSDNLVEPQGGGVLQGGWAQWAAIVYLAVWQSYRNTTDLAVMTNAARACHLDVVPLIVPYGVFIDLVSIFRAKSHNVMCDRVGTVVGDGSEEWTGEFDVAPGMFALVASVVPIHRDTMASFFEKVTTPTFTSTLLARGCAHILAYAESTTPAGATESNEKSQSYVDTVASAVCVNIPQGKRASTMPKDPEVACLSPASHRFVQFAPSFLGKHSSGVRSVVLGQLVSDNMTGAARERKLATLTLERLAWTGFACPVAFMTFIVMLCKNKKGESTIHELRHQTLLIQHEWEAMDSFFEQCGGYTWATGQASPFPWAKYVLMTGHDRASHSTCPSLDQAARDIGSSLGATWLNTRGGSTDTSNVAPNEVAVGKIKKFVFSHLSTDDNTGTAATAVGEFTKLITGAAATTAAAAAQPEDQ